MTHIHWIFIYYSSRTENGGLNDTTVVDVLAESYTEADDRAESLYPKANKGEHGGRLLQTVVEHLEGACTGGHH